MQEILRRQILRSGKDKAVTANKKKKDWKTRGKEEKWMNEWMNEDEDFYRYILG